jgi:predicted permease
VAFNSGLGVMMLGAGWAVVAGARLLPRWLGWIAVVLGALLFIPFADFIALLLTLIWIIVASIMLWRTHERSVVAATPQTA